MANEKMEYVNCLIGKHEFILSSLEPVVSQEKYDRIYTTTLNGGTYTTYGEFKHMEWNAVINVRLKDNYNVDFYNKVVEELESAPQMVRIPKINRSFMAMLDIKNVPDPHDDMMKWEVNIKQVDKNDFPKIDLRTIIVGDRTTVFDYTNPYHTQPKINE